MPSNKGITGLQTTTGLEEKEAAIIGLSAGPNDVNCPSGLLNTVDPPQTCPDLTIGPTSAINGELRDPELVMHNPWDDTTLPALGVPSEPNVMDEATGFWADGDNNGTGDSSDIPSPTSLDLCDDIDGTSTIQVEEDSELFPLSGFELEPDSSAANTVTEQYGDSPSSRVGTMESEGTSKLPNGLRVMQEWIAYQSSHGQLTVSAAESLLKTLNFCLENNMLLAEGHDKDTGM